MHLILVVFVYPPIEEIAFRLCLLWYIFGRGNCVIFNTVGLTFVDACFWSVLFFTVSHLPMAIPGVLGLISLCVALVVIFVTGICGLCEYYIPQGTNFITIFMQCIFALAIVSIPVMMLRFIFPSIFGRSAGRSIGIPIQGKGVGLPLPPLFDFARLVDAFIIGTINTFFFLTLLYVSRTIPHIQLGNAFVFATVSVIISHIVYNFIVVVMPIFKMPLRVIGILLSIGFLVNIRGFEELWVELLK